MRILCESCNGERHEVMIRDNGAWVKCSNRKCQDRNELRLGEGKQEE